jgi:hypothetical protein
MSYYELGGAAHGSITHYDVYPKKQTTYYWRWFAAAVLVVIIFGTSVIATKAFTSVEQATIELPKQATGTIGPQLTPQAQAVAAVVDRSPELQTTLEQWTDAQTESEWAFYVHSLEDGELQVGIDDSKPFELASIYKLFLLKPLAQKIPAEAWANTNVTDRSYLDCVQSMIRVSDNPCAEAIAGKLGWSVLHRQNHADGYKSTVFNRPDYLAGSAADTGLLLDRLYHGDGYDAKTKEIALEALGFQKRTEAIRRSCLGCTVYNKTGDLNGVRHDAAILEKNGKAYVVVIFSKNASWGQLANAAELINNHL